MKHLFVPIFIFSGMVLHRFVFVICVYECLIYLVVFCVLISMAEDVSLNAISHSLLKLDPIIFL